MSRPELGTKRMCPECSARFYDMKRNPPICPKCGEEMKLDETPSAKKRANTGNSDPKLAAAIKKPAVPHIPVIPLDSETDDELEAVKGGEEDDGVIEDASDIGDQSDDMSEVLEHVDEGVIDLG